MILFAIFNINFNLLQDSFKFLHSAFLDDNFSDVEKCQTEGFDWQISFGLTKN